LRLFIVSISTRYFCPIQFANLENRETFLCNRFHVHEVHCPHNIIAVAVATSDTGANRRVAIKRIAHLLFTDIFASFNIAETLWRKLKYEWLTPEDYASKEHLQMRLNKYCRHLE